MMLRIVRANIVILVDIDGISRRWFRRSGPGTWEEDNAIHLLGLDDKASKQMEKVFRDFLQAGEQHATGDGRDTGGDV